MAYFARQYSPSPVLTMSPQPAHQSMGMANFPHHATRFGNMHQLASNMRPAAGKKRSRDEASSNLEPDVKSLPVEAPEEEWVYGPGMVLIKPNSRYISDASTQSGTWLDEKKAEQASERRAVEEHLAVLRNPKLQRTVAPAQPIVAAPSTASQNTAEPSPLGGPQAPVIDDFTMHLGIGWRKISDAEHIQAAARGWARYIENHYPVSHARILLESNGLQSYLVEAAEGYFLFAENLRQGQLVSHTAEGAFRNLQCSPPRFDGTTTMQAAESPRLADTAMNMD